MNVLENLIVNARENYNKEETMKNALILNRLEKKLVVYTFLKENNIEIPYFDTAPLQEIYYKYREIAKERSLKVDASLSKWENEEGANLFEYHTNELDQMLDTFENLLSCLKDWNDKEEIS